MYFFSLGASLSPCDLASQPLGWLIHNRCAFPPVLESGGGVQDKIPANRVSGEDPFPGSQTRAGVSTALTFQSCNLKPQGLWKGLPRAPTAPPMTQQPRDAEPEMYSLFSLLSRWLTIYSKFSEERPTEAELDPWGHLTSLLASCFFSKMLVKFCL